MGDDKNTDEVDGNSKDSEDEDFIDDDYRVKEDDEDYTEIVSGKNSGTDRVIRSPNSQTSFNINVPVQGEDGGESEYNEDSELNSIHSETENDDDGGAKQDGIEFNAEKHMDNPFLEEGMKFGTFSEFKQAVKIWGIRNRY